ncbi:hypothetical protein A0130_09845 [Leifsonia xyli]|uniref:hypothetical protein n=1 Tax=Leifsonia xyli TaxID=1575 RepID=UPI0007CDA508|nr:hypothetical protein A0130_09845 [Leifsonia xyli]
MTAMDYAQDVGALARAASFALEGVTDFDAPHSAGVYLLELHVQTSRIGPLAAAQEALRIAFDAASIAVLHPEAANDPDAVEVLLKDPDIVLNLMWAGPGSLRQVFIADPITAAGRNNIRRIFAAGFIVLGLIPGGQIFAAAYWGALEGILLVGELIEHHQSDQPLKIRTIDDQALAASRPEVRIYPPGTPWRPPAHAAPDPNAEAFADLRDRIDELERNAQHDRATIGQLNAKIAALTHAPKNPE